jgi:2-polyprenyl-6-methoxyphenol hydroxylase-like FAD-dependent oxidoreductase
MTPNLAFGANNCLESAVVLCNELLKLVKPDEPKPSTAALSAAFDAYRKERVPRTKECCDLTNWYTGFAAWENFLFKLVGSSSFMMGLANMEGGPVFKSLNDYVKAGVRLDCVPLTDVKEGNSKWIHM